MQGRVVVRVRRKMGATIAEEPDGRITVCHLGGSLLRHLGDMDQAYMYAKVGGVEAREVKPYRLAPYADWERARSALQ